MPINFPNSPSPSQLYTYDNKTWEWNGTYWEVYSALTSYVGGTGTTQTISKWSGVNTLTDSQIYDDGTQVNIGGTQILGSLFSVVGTVGINEVQIQGIAGSIGITDNDLTSWSTGGGEVAIGFNGPLANSTGSNNVAIGDQSMVSNTSGGENVAVGRRSLLSNQTGQGNVAIGLQAGNGVTSGSYNVFIGYQAGEGSVTTQDNKLHIANTNTKTLIYGEFDNDFVGIGGALSAVTYQNLPGSSSANCFTTFYVTNISGCSPVNILSPLNVTDGLSVTGTSTFTSQVNFTGGISASTFSASTYQNLPVSAVTAGSGISDSTSNGVVTITNTDLGSSQNIFKNIQVGGVTQFSAGSNSSNLNFSGVNITITSAATNTLVFSAGTGGGGVTSVTTESGLSGSSTTGSITLINTQVQGITGITAGSGISATTTNNVTTISTNISASSITNATTVGQNLITLTNPSAIRYIRINADNSITSLTLAQLKSDLGLTQQVLSVGSTTTLTNTFEDIGFSFSVTNGKFYRWKVVMSVGSTSSSCFGVTGPTYTFMNYRFTCQNAATTVTIFGGVANDAGANAAFSSNGLVIGEGYVNPSADGTFKLRFRSATAATLTVRAGSSLSWEEVL